MSYAKLNLGRLGEEESIQFLKDNGYKILETNFKSKLGELDIVARNAKTICFVEVKTRSSLGKGDPLESITYTKKRKLSRLAIFYLKLKNLLDRPARFDVVSVYHHSGQTDIKLIKNAFDLDEFYIC